MSRLSQLIAELCPDGVKFVSIEDCVEKIKNIKWTESKGESYQYVDLASVDRDDNQITETQTINFENAPSRAQQIIQAGDVLFGTTRPMLRRYCLVNDDYDGQICSTGFCVLRANERIALKKWIYYQISSIAFFDHVEKYQKGASYPAISDTDVKSFKIPLPPIPVQHEIVRILDTFSGHIKALIKELTAELTVRKTQFEYYRELLLTYDEGDKLGVKWMTLGEVCESITSGKNDSRSDDGEFPVYGSTGIISYSNNFSYSEDLLLIARVGANAGFVHRATGKFDVSDNTLIVKPKSGYTISFAYYQLTNMNLNKMAVGGGQPLITAGKLKNLRVPVPPIEEQERIVSILDRLDAHYNDLSSALPAEIDARRKQYEYYRDKLLTFKEVTS